MAKAVADNSWGMFTVWGLRNNSTLSSHVFTDPTIERYMHKVWLQGKGEVRLV